MLADHPLITTALLKKLHTHTHTHPKIPHPLHPKLRLLVAHIYREVLSGKMFKQRQNMLFCPIGENQPEEDIRLLQQWYDLCGREQTNNFLPDIK